MGFPIGVKVPRQQLTDAIDGVIGDSGQHLSQVGFWITDRPVGTGDLVRDTVKAAAGAEVAPWRDAVTKIGQRWDRFWSVDPGYLKKDGKWVTCQGGCPVHLKDGTPDN